MYSVCKCHFTDRIASNHTGVKFSAYASDDEASPVVRSWKKASDLDIERPNHQTAYAGISGKVLIRHAGALICALDLATPPTSRRAIAARLPRKYRPCLPLPSTARHWPVRVFLANGYNRISQVARRAHSEVRAKVTSGEHDTFSDISQPASRGPS